MARNAHMPFNTKPPKPTWLCNPRSMYERTRNTVRGYDYWGKLYNATPWWICNYMNELRAKYRECPPGYEVDHIVPLNSSIVCGLHVPWNLRHLRIKENQAKSNHWWPDCPHEIEDLFPETKELQPVQMRLL